jgi:hypothetical protein
MTDRWTIYLTIYLTLFLAGVVPFALAGGLHDDTTIWPWSAGLLCQSGVVLGMIGYRRKWWS